MNWHEWQEGWLNSFMEESQKVYKIAKDIETKSKAKAKAKAKRDKPSLFSSFREKILPLALFTKSKAKAKAKGDKPALVSSFTEKTLPLALFDEHKMVDFGNFGYHTVGHLEEGEEVFKPNCPRCQGSDLDRKKVQAGYQPYRDYEYGIIYTWCKSCGYIGWEHWDDI